LATTDVTPNAFVEDEAKSTAEVALEARGSETAETSEASAHPAGETQGQVSRGYVMPLVHARVPERVIDVGFWTALGTVAVVGVWDDRRRCAGLFVLRRRHRSGRSSVGDERRER
jgi:hypothetical protein